MITNTSTSYGSVAKFFHWSVFVLVAGLLIMGSLFDVIPKSPFKETLFNVHKIIGLSVFLLMLLRVVWTLTNPKPALPSLKSWERVAERVSHVLLYVLLIAMPMSGWVMSTAADHNPYIGPVSLPAPWVPVGEPLAKLASLYHYFLAWSIFVIVCLHIIAALRHHFIHKDDVLRGMMPHGS